MIKKILFFLAVSLVFSITPLFLSAREINPPEARKVIAYYFHGTFRCPTCHKLEQYSKEAIETNFKDALDSGTLEFTVVNVETKGNEHYMRDYQLYTKSLVLSLVSGGKELKAKNLEEIWEYVGNKQKFFDYVKSEIQEFLKEL